jgi:hypothetical protein
MTILLILSGSGPSGAPPPVIEIGGITLVMVDIGNYVDDADVGNYIEAIDVGNYVDNENVGIYVLQIKSGTIVGPVGILRWGLAQFGTTGILGYGPPTSTPNSQRLNVIRANS